MKNKKIAFIKIIFSFFLLCAIVIHGFLIISCKKEQVLYDEDISLAKVYLKRKLSIGVYVPFPPIAFYKGNVLSGFDIEVLNEVCERLEIQPDFVVIDWSEKLELLKSEKIDVVASGFGLTPDRIGVFLMSRPILQNAQVIVVHGNSNLSSIRGLSGKKVGIQDSSTGESIMEERIKHGFHYYLNSYEDIEDGIEALKKHKIDAMIIDLLVINSYIYERGLDFKIIGEALQDEKYVYAFRMGDQALMKEIETTLIDMAKDGTLEMITRKWFNANISLIR